MTYCPDRTKGGCLVRPHYYRGDRGGQATFPQVTDLAIRLEPVLLPTEYGWITPGLLRLRLLCVISTYAVPQGQYVASRCRMPSRAALRRWLDKGLPRKMLSTCPELESITIALCSTETIRRKQTDWIVILPPK